MADTVPSDVTSTAVVPIGGSLYGTIETNGDHDWYRVNLAAGQTYQFRLHGMGTGQLRDPTLVLRDSTGAPLFLNDDAGASRWGNSNSLDSFIQYTASSSGTYFLDVGDLGDNETGNFLLSAVANNSAGMVFTNDEIAWQIVNNYNESSVGGSNSRPFAWNVGPGGALTVNITALTTDGQFLARNALQAWTDVTGINFTETSGAAQITFDDNASGTQAFANWSASGGFITSATVQITTGWLSTFGTGFQSYSFETYLHEIGHALGLGHGGNYNGSATYGTDNFYLNDSLAYSIMSYMQATGDEFGGGSVNTFVPANFRYMLTAAIADIIAVQNLYGVTAGTRTGNTIYGFNSNTGNAALDGAVTIGADMFMTVYDNGGTDTLDFSQTSATQSFNLNGESFSDVLGGLMNLSIARGVLIENAIGGSGSDTFTGNAANNTFTGNGGIDTVVFNGNRSQFSFIETNSYVVDETAVGGGTDTLNSVERFQFNDITVTDDRRGGTATTSSLGAGSSTTGDLQFLGDRDWVSVQLIAGHNYVLSERGAPTGAGTLTDALLRLHNAAGTQIAINDDGGIGLDSLLTVHASTSGTRYLDAGAYSDFNTGTYTLELRDLGTTPFQSAITASNLFGFSNAAGGWTSDNTFPREVADVNGDGLADIVGFGVNGAYVAPANVNGSGTFGAAALWSSQFGGLNSSGGWKSENSFPREVADVNFDGRADIVGFGIDGAWVALSNGAGFAVATRWSTQFGYGNAAGGWTSDDRFPRGLADVNGDFLADIVGFGIDGAYAALSTGAGFAAATRWSTQFGYGNGAGGWTADDRFPRELADVNGDGRTDIIGFGIDGVYAALSNGSGFAAATRWSTRFGYGDSAGGWTSDNTFHREVADVNGDGRADIIGFGISGVYAAISNGAAFEAASLVSPQYGWSDSAGGWHSDDIYPRELADVSGDARADIVGFGYNGPFVSQSALDFFIV